MPVVTDTMFPDGPAALSLGAEICELSAHIAVGEAQLARLVGEFDAGRGWAGDGIRSIAHWLSINCGLEPERARRLALVAKRWDELPGLAEAFAAGRLSLDKAYRIARVAVADDEEAWVQLAVDASATQLRAICCEYERVMHPNPDPRLQRGLWWHWRNDGLLAVRGLLDPEAGALLIAAIELLTRGRPVPEEKCADTPPRPEPSDIDPDETVAPDPATSDPAEDPFAARRADALMDLIEHAHATVPDELIVNPAARHVNVFIDLDRLYQQMTGDDGGGGRCHTDFDIPLPPAVAQAMACDATWTRLYQAGGLPVDTEPDLRHPNRRLRRAVAARDRGCQYPGCRAPSSRCEAHHLIYWKPPHGPTTLWNLAELCRYHHRRLHAGDFTLTRLPDGTLQARDRHGRPIAPPPPPVLDPDRAGLPTLAELATQLEHSIADRTPRAGDGGAPCDRTWIVNLMCDHHTIPPRRHRPTTGTDPPD